MVLLIIILTYIFLMKILNKLLSLELAIGSSLSQRTNLIFSFLFALIFTGIALSIENKTYVFLQGYYFFGKDTLF